MLYEVITHGVTVIEPSIGELASGLEGKGRMEDPETIVQVLTQWFSEESQKKKHPGKLEGKKVLITAGPTYESIVITSYSIHYTKLYDTPGLSDIGYHVIEFGATDLKDTTTFSFVMNVKQPSDLESLSNVMGVQVYPNPAESVLTIEMNEEPFNLRSVQLVDISGRVVYDDNYGDFSVGSLFRLNVSALPNGYYTLLLNSDSGRFTQKVIINRN